jgi:penicillin-binding protein 2
VRLTVLVVIVACLFATLFARLWFLQVVNAPRAQAAVQTNGYETVYIPAPRGDIISSDGVVLAGNRISQVITVNRQTAAGDPAMEGRLAALIGMTVLQLKTAINNLQISPYAPVPVLTDATNQQILYVKEHPAMFPGVSATQETVREYSPAGVAAANIVGYTGQIDAAQYAALKSKGYQNDEQIGESGIEESFESVLRGTPGVERLEVDASGNVLSMASYTPPVPGDNVVLTINSRDQEAAISSLESGLVATRQTRDSSGLQYRAPAGAVVVESPQTGDVLALATNPDYNPNEFVGGISEANYRAYTTPSSYYPLQDRAIAGQYAPGSTFKLVTATAALQRGMITPNYLFDDNRGGLQVGNHFFKNDGGTAYGLVDLAKAITVSDDAYFYNIGANFYFGASQYGADALQNVAAAYGFNSPTGISLPGEAPGFIPTPASVAKEHQQYPTDYPNGTFYAGDETQVAIGQGQDLVTPLQMANAYATFANGGTEFTPRIATVAETPAGKVAVRYGSKVKNHVLLSAADHAAMLQGFEGVTANPQGTAYGAFQNFPILVAGKTGTAQVSSAPPGSPGYKENNSVFTSFAPAQNPEFVVTCFMEQSGYGASAAAPVVRSVYNTLFNQPGGLPVGIRGSD